MAEMLESFKNFLGYVSLCAREGVQYKAAAVSRNNEGLH
jgi:hypothetical protein